MGTLLDIARSVTPRPVGGLRLSEFAKSSRLVRLAVPDLEAPGTETSIVLAGDNADISAVPADVVIFWPDEIVEMYQAGGTNRLLWEAKRHFGPHLRSDSASS
jgi:hypothetical protein